MIESRDFSTETDETIDEIVNKRRLMLLKAKAPVEFQRMMGNVMRPFMKECRLLQQKEGGQPGELLFTVSGLVAEMLIETVIRVSPDLETAVKNGNDIMHVVVDEMSRHLEGYANDKKPH